MPLVVARPGGPPVRRRSDEVVSLADVAPAICHWLGIPCSDLGPPGAPAETGRRDSVHARDDALAHLVRGRTGSDHAWIGHHAKVIEGRDGTIDVFGPPTFPGNDLLPVATFSRGDTTHASSFALDSVRAMDARVAAARERAGLLHPPAPRPTAAIDDATRGRLESLGYLPRAEEQSR